MIWMGQFENRQSRPRRGAETDTANNTHGFERLGSRVGVGRVFVESRDLLPGSLNVLGRDLLVDGELRVTRMRKYVFDGENQAER